ncbi:MULTISPECIES: type VI secretion system Vgr family protein [Paraburkholderia]|uniref:type VI secretion system Vgr family protein n=1 Tax=Paraburkholderia TaxID=1822464 RepID=UPI001B2E95CD|nr:MULTISPECIES: type VI secretion system Vgr family protein [Paraburkholderia]MCX4154611.1 type VI secretion system tip protein TssI/VgrG [Paraburkholderia aspalathi]MDN7164026.1 type VI secretion system tip protein VgrG [Paraburkholderia sp. SECH2]MDQ6392511.1 type VI secretion system tip protein VgrG [Paraburkholderia aspalathi]CAE6784056.1 Actin cross-linking toxin VgrG1 [Paraburkholderia aspalathi]
MSFASIGSGNGAGGSPIGSLAAGGVLGDVGSIAGLAGQAGSLAGVPGAGLMGGAARAVQLAQTGMSLLGRTPASIADSINGASGLKPQLTQENRFIKIESPLGGNVLLVSALVADEFVSQLPEIHLDLLSHQNNIEIEKIVGQRVKITLDPQSANTNILTTTVASPDSSRRYFHGYAASFSRVGNSGTVTRYEMTVVPWFWFLTRSSDCRIFQNETAQDILTSIFKELGFSDFEFHIQSERPQLEYVVMYQESYYNFCARLMEQEGLFWTFRYEKDKHVLVIGDSNSTFAPIENLKTIPYYADSSASELNGIDRWDEAFSFRVGKVTFRDFNYNAPSSPLMHVEVPTATLKNPNIGSTERYEYHSLYDHGNDGERYARYAMEAEEAQARQFTGSGYASRMTTVGRFTLVNHPVSTYNKDFVILHVRHQAVNDYSRHEAEMPYRNTFTCLPRDVPFRPERRTPKPYMHGTQAAIVVGPKGEEIYTDGSRVKLHFMWDRRGKQDGSDSMWVRVSQPWAGKGWGGSAIPRIGQEVIVAFNEGDPDNPVIVGRVFNGESGNPYHGSSGQTMGLKSQTHKGDGSNELRFSDVNGAQEFFMHAQKDMNTVVENAQSTQVLKGDRSIAVAKGDHLTTVSVGDLQDAVTKGNTTQQTPAGVHTIEAKELWIKVGGEGGTKIHMTADAIEIYKGSSVIHIDDGQIKVQAGNTHINPDNG